MNPKSINKHQTNASSLADNLSTLLKNRNLNATSLADALGIPMMTIRRLLCGETTDPRISTLKAIADYFDIPLDDLITTTPHHTVESCKRTKSYLVPLLNWEMAEKMTVNNNINLLKHKRWQSISLNEQENISRNTFALESRPSMYPRFPQGTIFIIDPELIPTDGDIILIRIKKTKEITLRELHIDPPQWQLHSVISGQSFFEYAKVDHETLGIVSLTILYNRKA